MTHATTRTSPIEIVNDSRIFVDFVFGVSLELDESNLRGRHERIKAMAKKSKKKGKKKAGKKAKRK